jgi:hypothetical protein
MKQPLKKTLKNPLPNTGVLRNGTISQKDIKRFNNILKVMFTEKDASSDIMKQSSWSVKSSAIPGQLQAQLLLRVGGKIKVL